MGHIDALSRALVKRPDETEDISACVTTVTLSTDELRNRLFSYQMRLYRNGTYKKYLVVPRGMPARILKKRHVYLGYPAVHQVFGDKSNV